MYKRTSYDILKIFILFRLTPISRSHDNLGNDLDGFYTYNCRQHATNSHQQMDSCC
jgi:hypothetical protein